MARTCKRCTHTKQAELDRELVANHRPYSGIAHDFAVSTDSVFNPAVSHTGATTALHATGWPWPTEGILGA